MSALSLPEFSTLYCIKGSRYYGLVKNRVYPVLKAEIQDDHRVAIVLQLTDRRLTLFAHHPNRVADRKFSVNDGNPTKTAYFSLDQPN